MNNLDKAKLLGTGESFKGSAYQVYELDGKYYSVIIDGLGYEIVEDTITEITFDEIKNYIKIQGGNNEQQ